MTELTSRLRAIADLTVADVRENAGRHEYDGLVQDLSPAGVASGLRRLGDGERLDDPHDEAHLTAFEEGLRFRFDEYESHRRDPLVHLDNLDLAAYDREYAPAADRERARMAHLRLWPDAVDAALASLDRVSSPVAQALIPAARGLAAGLDADAGGVQAAALSAHARLVAHLEAVARDGDPDAAIGGPLLARAMGVSEAMDVDLNALAREADSERDRLQVLLSEAVGRIAADRPVAELLPELLADHPDADGVLEQARAMTEEVIAWTAAAGLAPYTDGQCLVGPAPESRRWAMAMLSWAAPFEEDAPSWYHVTPPEASWPEHERQEWLSVFSRTTLPAITVHEVSPGHFAHGRALRHAPTDVRRLLMSSTFAEGWAHYVEEVALEEGFREGDPHYQAGMCLEALVRVTRLACAIGLHTGAMDVEEATRRFERDAYLGGSAAASEARRGTFDVCYGRYTWGKLQILDLRERARKEWGAGFDLARFHRALLDLGSPPLGLIGTAVERG